MEYERVKNGERINLDLDTSLYECWLQSTIAYAMILSYFYKASITFCVYRNKMNLFWRMSGLC